MIDLGHYSFMADGGSGGGDFLQADYGGDFFGGGDYGNVFDAFGVDVADVLGPVAPTGGGATDLGINPDTGAVRMDFTGMAPGSVDTIATPGDLDFGPGATYVDNSTNIRDILGPDPTPVDFSNPAVVDQTPIDWTPLPVGGEILTPDQYTGAADNLVVDTGPYQDTGVVDTTGFGDYVSPGGNNDAPYDPYTDEGPSQPSSETPTIGPDVVPDLGEVEIVDNKPVVPSIDEIPDLGEVEIVDTRPDSVRPVIPEGPVIEQPPYDPPIIDAPPIDITLPVVPEPEIPEIEIVDERPVVPVVPEPEIPEIEIVDERPVKPVEPEIPEIEIVEPRPTCPAPEMMILLADGSEKPAGELKIGDKVMTQHEHTLEWGEHNVIHKEIIPNVARLKIKFENREFVGSHDHKFSVEKDVWVKAADVKVGDVLSGLEVKSIEPAEDGPVVMLTIEDAHTYISQDLLSHNKSPLPPDEPPDIVVPEPPIVEPEPPIVEPPPPWEPPPIVEPPPPWEPPPPPPPPPPQQGGNLNPGWIPYGVTPFYQTTNPTQAQYYWGAHPYMRNMDDLANYNYVPDAPKQPWGYQTTPPSAYQFNPQDLARGVYTPMTQPQQAPVDMRTLKAPANPAIWQGMIPPSANAPWITPISAKVNGPVNPGTTPTTPTTPNDTIYEYNM